MSRIRTTHDHGDFRDELQDFRRVQAIAPAGDPVETIRWALRGGATVGYDPVFTDPLIQRYYLQAPLFVLFHLFGSPDRQHVVFLALYVDPFATLTSMDDPGDDGQPVLSAPGSLVAVAVQRLAEFWRLL